MRTALAIAFVSTLIAATTFRGGQWDSSGTSCTRALAEAQMYEVVRDQARKDRIAERARAQSEYDNRVSEGLSLLRTAQMLRKRSAPNTLEAERVTMSAQIQLAIARTVRPVLDFTNPSSPDFAASDESPSDPTRGDLRESVLREQCPHVTLASGASTAEGFVDELTRDVEQIHEISQRVSLLSILLTVALFLLTVSDLVRNTRIARLFFILAMLVVTIVVNEGALQTATFDVGLRWYFLIAAAGYATVVVAVAPLIVHLDAAPHIGSPVRRESITAMLVVGIITVAALANAVGSTFYSRAGGTANLQSADAQNLQFQILRASDAFRTRAYSTIDGMVQLREAAIGVNAPRDARVRSPVGVRPNDWSLLSSRDSARWQALSSLLGPTKPSENPLDAAAAKLEDITRGPYGPYLDPKFPARFFVDRTVETPARLFAVRDAYDERGNAWETQARRLLGALAALALAAYLGVEALRVRHSRATVLLGFFGVTALLTALGVGAWAVLTKGPPFDDYATVPDKCRINGEDARLPRYIAAAVCFSAASYEARQHHDADAIELYEDAYSARQGFTVAHFLAILTEIAHPQAQSLRQATVEERRAFEEVDKLDLSVSEPLADNLGYHELLLALSTGEPEVIQSSVTDTGHAAHARPLKPALWFHYALALLASRAVQHARLAFDRGVQLMISGTDQDEASPAATRSAKEDVRRQIASDAISDLELFRGRCTLVMPRDSGINCDQIRLLLDFFEARVIHGTWLVPKTYSRLHLREGLEIAVTPGGIGWRVPRSKYGTPGSAVLVMVVLAFDDDLKYWRVLPDLSYQIDPSTIVRQGAWLTGYRSYLIRSRYAQCLRPDLYYRVEFFVDGRLVAQQDVSPFTREAYAGVAFREPGAAMCVPARWIRSPAPPGALAGAYRTGDATRGAALYGFLDGRPPEQPAVAESTMEIAIGRTLRSLGDGSLSRRPFKLQQARCETYFDAHALRPHIELALPTRMLLAKSWRTPDGLDLIGVVWQGSGARDALSCSVLTSMTTVDRDVSTVRQ